MKHKSIKYYFCLNVTFPVTSFIPLVYSRIFSTTDLDVNIFEPLIIKIYPDTYEIISCTVGRPLTTISEIMHEKDTSSILNNKLKFQNSTCQHIIPHTPTFLKVKEPYSLEFHKLKIVF